jgi:hypothetical protein
MLSRLERVVRARPVLFLTCNADPCIKTSRFAPAEIDAGHCKRRKLSTFVGFAELPDESRSKSLE